MEILGYISAILIGLSLGLIGGGGSILTVPVLVYLFRLQPGLATSYSLFIVGFTSLIGAYGNFKRKQVSIPTALLYGSSSVLTVLATRRYLLPVIPEELFQLGGFTVTKSIAMMVLFAVLMILAAVSMIKPSKQTNELVTEQSTSYGRLMLYGVVIGLITGLLGAGGGFLLIPALIFLMKMPMKKAIGTSLFIIALNSLIGFIGDIGHFTINWNLLLTLSALAVTGILIGGWLSKRINGAFLKTGFGWFVLAMGVYIIVTELIK
ncbi:sulfite exporter TauE/SafE family protein [Chitinophaga silvatica]|nr:sulfite exporter TauE/SafE family protein [Chitinophaga silvatica]